MGAKKKPFYRIVVAEASAPRDGGFIATLGYYDPGTDPPTVEVNTEEALQWLDRGAKPTDTARSLLRRAGVLKVRHERRKSGGAPVESGE